eukprot:10855592-Ditylum_brightwellii.AAC.1
MQWKSSLHLRPQVQANKERMNIVVLCAETANHLVWGMTGETVLCIEGEHKQVGVEDLQPYLHCHWAMDN